MNKSEMIKRIHAGRNELEALWAKATEKQMITRPGPQPDWSVKDLITHLTYWEQSLIHNLDLAATGGKPTWCGDVDTTNAQVFEISKARSLADVQSDFQHSLEQIIHCIHTLPDDLLYDSQRFDWRDGEPLWKYVTGETFEHYHDHISDLRSWHHRVLAAG